jgi:hypothetical protein
VAEFSPLAGSLVSTNAQNYSFGSKTSAGTAFAFGVAGPSEKEDGTQRTTDGFYYVCLPSAFLSTKFNTTPTNAARYWMGTRDGAKDSPAVAAIGNCGVGAGLVGSRINFQFSTPLFSWEPDTALIAAEEASAAAASAAAAQAAQAAARAAAVAQSKTELTTTVTTGKAPTATQYAASDITGVTAKNVDAINKEVLALSAKDQADISKVQMIAKKYELADRFAAGKPASLSELISAGLLEKTNPVRSTIAAKLKKLPAASVDTVAKLQQVIAAEVATYNARKAKIDARKAKAAK